MPEEQRKSPSKRQIICRSARKPRSVEIGDMVYLRVKPNSSLKTGRCTKLSPRYCGLFEILEKINEVAYRLKLPSHVRIHPVFHVSYLKKALSRFDNTLPTYVDVQEVEQETHDPIGILEKRTRRLRNRDITEYLIEWSNKPKEEVTWESTALAREVGLIGDNDLRELGRDVTY